MNEKEKMNAGLLYDACKDENLFLERQKCKELCQKYNRTSPELLDERKAIMKQILGKTGKEFLIEQNFFCDYGYNVKIGENFYANHNLVILDPAAVEFGDNVFVGPNCGFYTAEHPLDAKTRIKGLEYAKPIKVGDNVWFGGNVAVLAGVTIGKNAVIGAGSVVTEDIPENALAVGNPCKVLRFITQND